MLAAMVSNFTLNNALTYRDRRRRGWRFFAGLLMFSALCSIGVIGGVVTFGILGIFLGPMLLALGLSLTREWLQLQAGPPAVTSARIDGA